MKKIITATLLALMASCACANDLIAIVHQQMEAHHAEQTRLQKEQTDAQAVAAEQTESDKAFAQFREEVLAAQSALSAALDAALARLQSHLLAAQAAALETPAAPVTESSQL